MNIASISIFVGLLTLSVVTMPWGLLILAGMAWLYWKS